jgi:hypothetical protein
MRLRLQASILVAMAWQGLGQSRPAAVDDCFANAAPSGPKIDRLPVLVRCALSLVPNIDPAQVVVLDSASGLTKYLLEWGYSRQVSDQTVQEIEKLAEFTIDHHYPIFINRDTYHYRRILKSWQEGKRPDEAARVLASDLYHEHRHILGDEEAAALQAHVLLLTQWRAKGLLSIADPYIRAKYAELSKLRKHGSER